jgi:hypothetical protein
MNRFLLLCLLVTAPGCSAMMETIDRGLALEKEGRTFERASEFAKGRDAYAKAEVELAEGLVLAQGRKQQVFVSLMNHKLSLVSSGQARCVRPDNDPTGSWDAAMALFEQAGEYAMRSAFLKLKMLSVCDRADCLRPDKNPESTWEKAAATYAEAAKISKDIDDDEGRGMALRLQAICLMEGKTDAKPNKVVKRLLQKARKLGDEDAADMLLETDEGQFCVSCGSGLDAGTKFCGRCGADQAPPVKKKAEQPTMDQRHPNDPGRKRAMGGRGGGR